MKDFATYQNRKAARRRLSVAILWLGFCNWLRGRDLNPRPLGYENEAKLSRVLFSLL